MTDQELQFHYFKMHDADNNNKLDGSELIKSLIHWHEEDAHGHKVTGVESKPAYTDDDLEALIDSLLKDMDTNHDGYVTYSEYRMGS